MTEESTDIRADRLAPHSIEAEEAFLGSLLIDSDLLADVAGIIKVDHFFIVRNAWIYSAMLQIYKSHDDLDYVTLVDKLREIGKLDDIGGAAYITWLINHTPASIFAESYGHIIERAFFRREALDASSELAILAHSETGDIDSVVQGVSNVLDELLQKKPQHDLLLSGKNALDYYRQVLTTRTAEDAPNLITLPWEGASQAVPVVPLGKVVTISGFPGSGKSIALEQISEWAAMLGNRCFFIDAEMTRRDRLDRMACRYTGLPYATVQQPNDEANTILEKLENEVAPWLPRMEWWVTKNANSDQVLAQMRRAMSHGFRYFFLDYLQRISLVIPKGYTALWALDNFIQEMEGMVKQNDLVLFIASQLTNTLNGPITKGSNKLNEVSACHIRLDTVKQKVDRVYSVDNRLVYARKGKRSPIFTAKVVKSRFGDGTADWPLFLDGARSRFLGEEEISFVTADDEEECDQIPARRSRRKSKKELVSTGPYNDE